MVRISICGTCKHLWPDREDNACPAFPEGRKNFDDLFPYADEECGNGVRFEPNEESKGSWTAQMYKNFSRPTPDELEWEVVVGNI